MEYLFLFFSVALGYLVALFLKKRELRDMEVFLAFSGAFLLSVTIFELLPEVFAWPSKHIGVFIMVGILLQILLEFFSKGAEHGHIHLHSENKSFPWLLFISLCIHAFMEGFPISKENNLLLGVIVHKIPVAIILSFFFIFAGYKRSITLLFLFFFAIMTPIGNFISNNSNFVKPFETEITAVVIGIFLHVSTTILFESSKDHRFNPTKMISIILGIVIAYFI